jgi:alpha-amylase
MYKPEYEGLGRVMCYNQAIYTPNRESATLKANCRQHDSIVKMEYKWGDNEFSDESEFDADTALEDALTLTVKATDGDGKEWTITMEPYNFVWQGAQIEQPENYKGGQKGAIVELFGWPYADIKEECEFLGKAGYMAVKVFPPQESVTTDAWP